MRERERDFHLTVDRAAGLAVDATSSASAAVALPLPFVHRTMMRRAIRNLERAQDDLFNARNTPLEWPQRPRRPIQLELLP